MTIKVGDRLPAGTLMEYFDVEKDGCSIGPNPVKVEDLTKGKKVVIFGLPGAYTPTCSAKHVPGYLANYDELKAKGVDEISCVSVNDAFVMAAWGQDRRPIGKVRMLGDGSADFAKKLGLELDLTGAGMGVRMNRFSMLVDDGVVKQVNVEAPGKFEVSDGETMLKQLASCVLRRFAGPRIAHARRHSCSPPPPAGRLDLAARSGDSVCAGSGVVTRSVVPVAWLWPRHRPVRLRPGSTRRHPRGAWGEPCASRRCRVEARTGVARIL